MKGFEFEKGRYVVMDEEDMSKVRPESTRVIDLVQFAPVDSIDPIYVERPYYLAPDDCGELSALGCTQPYRGIGGDFMAEALKRISFDVFLYLSDGIEQVIHEHESVLVLSESGELVEVKPVNSTKSQQRKFTREDDEAFLSAAGSWHDVDIDSFLKDISESRH